MSCGKWFVGALVVLSLLYATAYGAENVVSKKSNVILGGRLHFQFQTSDTEAAEDMKTTFKVRRARLAAEYVNTAGTMKGKVQYDLAEGGAKLKDGYVELKLSPEFNVKVGQYKKPFSLWELTSTTKTMVIERGNAVMGSGGKASNQIIGKDGLYAGRDIGAMVYGKTDKVKYSVGVFNGNGDNKKTDSDNGKLIGGRVVLSAAKDLSIGGSFSSRTVSKYENFVDTTKNGTSASFQAFEADLEYGIKNDVSKCGIWVQAEFVGGANPHISDEGNFMGVLFVGSYNHKLAEGGKIYSVRPAIRVDYAKRNTDDDDTANILLTPALDLFFDKYNRVQINLDINMPQEDKADTEMGVRVQVQMHV